MTGISGYTNRTTLQMTMLADMRWQIDDLQRQLATGKRADTYAGLGIGRTLDLEARMRLSRIESYTNSIDQVGLRVDIMNTALERLRTVGQDIRSDVAFPIEYELIGNGQTQAQSLAAMRLDAALAAAASGPSLADALDAEAARTAALRPLLALLAASERSGAPVAAPLLRLAAATRVQSRRRAMARARAVPVLLLFPLVFLVLPAFLVLTVAPVVLASLTH